MSSIRPASFPQAAQVNDLTTGFRKAGAPDEDQERCLTAWQKAVAKLAERGIDPGSLGERSATLAGDLRDDAAKPRLIEALIPRLRTCAEALVETFEE